MNLDDIPDIPPYPKANENENSPDPNPALLAAAFDANTPSMSPQLDMKALVMRNKIVIETLHSLSAALASAQFWLTESARLSNKLIGVQAASNNVVDELARLAGTVHTHLTLVDIHARAFTELVDSQEKQLNEA